MGNNLLTTFEKIPQKKKSFHPNENYWKSDLYQQQIGFDCMHCQHAVTSMIALSAVNNRNHCPYCLWSKHVDHFQAGDRLSACKMPMQPIGLTFKLQRNKYGNQLGELMVIHQCSGCQSLSINRIAADDDNQRWWLYWMPRSQWMLNSSPG